MLRSILALLVVAAVVVGGLYTIAARGTPPSLTILQPDRPVGDKGTLEFTAASDGGVTSLTVTIDQGGRTRQLFSLTDIQGATIAVPDVDHIHVFRPFGKQTDPDLQAGTAQIVVAATRRSFLGLKTLSATASKSIEIRLDPPRVRVLSTHHYVNHGGSEMVLYQALPPGVTSGVRVGGIEYTGFPVAGQGMPDAGPGVNAAFFALLPDQAMNTDIKVFARNSTGAEVTASFVDNLFEKTFRKSRIDVDDRYFAKVVPGIIEHTPDLQAAHPAGLKDEELQAAFLEVNGKLRAANAAQILALTARTAPTRLWNGPFVQLGNSKVEASFADYRTYVDKGKAIDEQVHLGFDLAATANTPVLASNAGTVLNASWLGIYGNCVILDHGMGVASLYGHLSSFDVKVGDTVTKGQLIGKTGQTGLAGGDHLHFTMLVGGHPVNPVEWWDPHWVQDRVERKFLELAGSSAPREAGGPPSSR